MLGDLFHITASSDPATTSAPQSQWSPNLTVVVQHLSANVAAEHHPRLEALATELIEKGKMLVGLMKKLSDEVRRMRKQLETLEWATTQNGFKNNESRLRTELQIQADSDRLKKTLQISIDWGSDLRELLAELQAMAPNVLNTSSSSSSTSYSSSSLPSYISTSLSSSGETPLDSSQKLSTSMSADAVNSLADGSDAGYQESESNYSLSTSSLPSSLSSSVLQETNSSFFDDGLSSPQRKSYHRRSNSHTPLSSGPTVVLTEAKPLTPDQGRIPHESPGDSRNRRKSVMSDTSQSRQQVVSVVGDPRSSMMPTHIKSGWMKKRGGVVKNWKKRFFVLKVNGNLVYAKDEELTQTQGVIPIKSEALEIGRSPDLRKFGFFLRTENRTYYFECTSQHTMNDWMTAMQIFLKR